MPDPEARIDEALRAIDRGEVAPSTLRESARDQERLFGRDTELARPARDLIERPAVIRRARRDSRRDSR